VSDGVQIDKMNTSKYRKSERYSEISRSEDNELWSSREIFMKNEGERRGFFFNLGS